MKLIFILNSLHGGPKLINEAGEVVFKSDYLTNCRTYCEERGIESVRFDRVSIPVDWIGDGHLLENSDRVLSLIRENEGKCS